MFRKLLTFLRVGFFFPPSSDEQTKWSLCYHRTALQEQLVLHVPFIDEKRKVRKVVIHFKNPPGMQVPWVPGPCPGTRASLPFLPTQPPESIPFSRIPGSTRTMTSRSGCASESRHSILTTRRLSQRTLCFCKESMLFIFPLVSLRSGQGEKWSLCSVHG